MSDRNQGLYPTEVIANLFGVTERRVEQLTKKRIIPKAGRGLYDLASTVQAYIRYLQGLCSGAIKSDDSSELDQRLLEARVLERESKARQAKYRADAMERELREEWLRNEIQKLPRVLSEVLSERDEYRLGGVLRSEAALVVAKAVDIIVNKLLKGEELP